MLNRQACLRTPVRDVSSLNTPLAASGLTLKQRLEKVAASLERVVEKGGHRRRLRSCNR